MKSVTIVAIAILTTVAVGPSFVAGAGTYVVAAISSVFVPLIGWKKLFMILFGELSMAFLNPEIWGYITVCARAIHSSWIVACALVFSATYALILYVTFECYHYLKKHGYISQHCYGV